MAKQNLSFIDQIRTAIRADGGSLYSVAKRCGVAVQILQRIMSGQRDNIMLDVAEKLCAGLRLTLRPGDGKGR